MSLVAAATQQPKHWLRARTSELVDHGACCAAAKSWLVASARSFDYAATDDLRLAAPRWLNKRFAWGPSTWPLSWCEAVKCKAIDCGVFSAFAREIFAAKGLQVFPAQVLRTYAAESNTHWRRKWDSVPQAFNWIGDDVVYHEVCGVRVGDDRMRIYDPTDGIWLDAELTTGHMSHVAIRVELPIALYWGERLIVNGQWMELCKPLSQH